MTRSRTQRRSTRLARLTRLTRLTRLMVAGATCLALSACGTHPGAAAVVGSQRISSGDVDSFARALCFDPTASANGQVAQAVSSRTVRESALRNLVEASLSRQFGRAQGVEPDQEQVSAFLSSNEAALNKVPADRRAVLVQRLRELVEGQLTLVAVGRQELRRQGVSSITDQKAYDAGAKARDAWVRKHLDVSVDPRYGSYAKGQIEPAGGSLSVPVSAHATAATQSLKGGQPSSSWVASLPASQKCS